MKSWALILLMLLVSLIGGCAGKTPSIPAQKVELTEEQWEYLRLSGYYQKLAEDTFNYAYQVEQDLGLDTAYPYYKKAFEYEDKAAYYYELVYGQFSYKKRL